MTKDYNGLVKSIIIIFLGKQTTHPQKSQTRIKHLPLLPPWRSSNHNKLVTTDRHHRNCLPAAFQSQPRHRVSEMQIRSPAQTHMIKSGPCLVLAWKPNKNNHHGTWWHGNWLGVDQCCGWLILFCKFATAFLPSSTKLYWWVLMTRMCTHIHWLCVKDVRPCMSSIVNS